MNNTTPHKHAALIKEWADHLATGKVAAGWYKAQIGNMKDGWYTVNEPNWRAESYRIVMTDKHPDYKPPVEMITVSFEMHKEEAIRFDTLHPYKAQHASLYLANRARTAIKQALEKQE